MWDTQTADYHHDSRRSVKKMLPYYFNLQQGEVRTESSRKFPPSESLGTPSASCPVRCQPAKAHTSRGTDTAVPCSFCTAQPLKGFADPHWLGCKFA